jgi:uncharacterized membrane protein required for colicin V production
MDAYALTDIALGVMAIALLCIGLFRGFSGEIASFSGFLGAIFTCFFLKEEALHLAAAIGCSTALLPVAGGAFDLIFGIIAYGLIRAIVNKFISMCVPQPTNALLGMAIGLAKALGIAVALIWFNIAGTDENAFFEVKSPIMVRIAELVGDFARSSGDMR